MAEINFLGSLIISEYVTYLLLFGKKKNQYKKLSSKSSDFP
jgi:hypothetical protein